MESFSQIGKVEAIRRLYEGTEYSTASTPSFESAEKEKVTQVSRVFLEGMDFDLMYFPLKHLGYKVVVMTTGELYAGLCEARVLNIVLGVSAKLDFERIRDLWGGIVLAAHEFGYRKVALDMVPSANGLCISVGAAGAVRSDWLSGAKAASSKDILCITGNLGAAYLGLQVLEKEKKSFDGQQQPDLEQYKQFVGAYLKPSLKAHIPSLLKEAGYIPSCAYFVKYGLADAMLHVAKETGLGVKVYADRIPFAGDTIDTAKKLGLDAMTAALAGGDDSRLLFTLPIDQYESFRRDFQEFEVIGHLALPEVGAAMVLPDGVELPVTAQGWSGNDE